MLSDSAKKSLRNHAKSLRRHGSKRQLDVADLIDKVVDSFDEMIPGASPSAKILRASASVADQKRLRKTYKRIWELMADGEYRTLHQIASHAGCMTTSASAALRAFRRPDFGMHKVDAKNMGNGVWRYRLQPNEKCKMVLVGGDGA